MNRLTPKTYRMPVALHRELIKFSRREGMNMSDVVRNAVANAIGRGDLCGRIRNRRKPSNPR